MSFFLLLQTAITILCMRLYDIRYICIVVLCVTMFTTSCYEPYNYNDFEKGDKNIVIEGIVNNIDSVTTIKISRTVEANSSKDFDYVDDAEVVVKDDAGNTTLFENMGNGIYQTCNVKGAIGTQYLFSAKIGDNVYSAIDKMPSPINIDSVVVKYQDNYNFFDSIGYYISIYSTQKVDSLRYYRIDVERNGVMLDGYAHLWLYEDALLSDEFRMTIPYNFKSSDKVIVKVSSISKPIYEYFVGLSKQFTINFSNIQPPLTNPIGNIKPRIMGYFQASSVVRMEFVIAEGRQIVRQF